MVLAPPAHLGFELDLKLADHGCCQLATAYFWPKRLKFVECACTEVEVGGWQCSGVEKKAAALVADWTLTRPKGNIQQTKGQD